MMFGMHISNAERFKSREERRREVATDGIERITISFYKYVHLNDPYTVRERLFASWYRLGCLGRIYIASEGINAQMSIPQNNWQTFEEELRSWDEFADVPFKIAVQQNNASFFTLTVKVKNKIVADGLDDASFDPSQTGGYLNAQEMNEYIDDPDAVVIDMRNAYESEIGHFEHARCMQVDTFREQLQRVVSDFKQEKDKKIALYCTGGIRCEKASAWMKHNGFTDVKHVRGGIIDYKHQVEQQGLENKFRGTNFVFDERLGERIGEEVISHCHLCSKQKSDQYHHCRYQPCHVLFIGCADCMKKNNGYCSFACCTKDCLPKQVKRYLARTHPRNSSGVFRKNTKRTVA